MVVNDIIEITINRFRDFGLCMLRINYLHEPADRSDINYYVYVGSTRIGFVFFDDNGVTNIYTRAGSYYSNVCYADFDVDILVGLFLCEVYYGS